MKRLYYNIVYAICVIAGFSSCSDFLVIEPQNEIIFEKFWNEKADVEAIIAGCYSGMQEEAVIKRMMVWGEFRSDNVGPGSNVTSDGNLERILKENIDANQPIIDLIAGYAEAKNATNAQIALAWMLHKYPNVVPIPGSKNQGRILENLGAWNVSLTDSEFTELEKALNVIPVHGHRGFVQYEGSKISDWGKK